MMEITGNKGTVTLDYELYEKSLILGLSRQKEIEKMSDDLAHCLKFLITLGMSTKDQELKTKLDNFILGLRSGKQK